ncbi:MAG TPA: 3-deoxy-8-phosphooctulonate synthase [Thermoanaerobaculia bacterium]|nr:3-deoxy-8-phosphooctulonate synthase [Thermoanaerobaculia bacterium]HUM30342.1 3-deoxy-8-phosphooctulonate synthase [Thermoanaerobaculia bacterium]HXK68507.1 3-deoxy-8-phosphooctulonate synthase [Thermoanaerobaculia bacterium]
MKRILLFAGPCVIESLDHSLTMAEKILEITRDLPVDFVFKSSFDKANRTSLDSYRGPGLDRGLSILSTVRDRVGVPVITDIHLPEQAEPASQAVDILQIPAFLCRQTDLLVAAGSTGRPVNIKKGQFMSPADMGYAVEKTRTGGSQRVTLTERGTFFGYGNLVVDMRSLVMMRDLADGVIFDATHSVQLPGGAGGKSGGLREFILPLSKAAAAVGVDGFFLEVHDRPEAALSDAGSQLALNDLPSFLETILSICSAGERP